MDCGGSLPILRDVPHLLPDYSTSEVFHVSLTFSSVQVYPSSRTDAHPSLSGGSQFLVGVSLRPLKGFGTPSSSPFWSYF